MIPLPKRGMYQAMQNILVGLGAVLGASLGGVVAECIGWRWCFLVQVPVSLAALVVGYKVLCGLSDTTLLLPVGSGGGRLRHVLACLDLSGAAVLVLGLTLQLVGLGSGGNDFAWDSPVVIGALALSTAALAGFVAIEAKTEAIPIIPLRLLKGFQPAVVQLTNFFAGMASYAVSGAPTPLLLPVSDRCSICS